jgi:hypothetical protein
MLARTGNGLGRLTSIEIELSIDDNSIGVIGVSLVVI